MFRSIIEEIKPLHQGALKASKERWDNIGKPIEGLGLFEELITKVAGIQGTEEVTLEKKAVVIMCSDNGIVKEGVTQTGQEVTAIVTENFAKGIASVNVMANTAGADVFPVDVGVNAELSHKGVVNRKIAFGTKNMKYGPAMTKEETIRAIQTGISMVRILQSEGYQIIATGEMGIGNTSTSSAVASVLLNMPVEEATGKGAGLSDSALTHKIEVIGEAIRVNQPNKSDPIDVLSKVGGLDIAGLVGIFLGGAMYQVPIVIDGLITATAALVAKRICPVTADYMLASHEGKEPASRALLKELGLQAPIHGRLALGEGTGAVLLFPLLDMALNVYNSNRTFDEIHVDAYEKFS